MWVSVPRDSCLHTVIQGLRLLRLRGSIRKVRVGREEATAFCKSLHWKQQRSVRKINDHALKPGQMEAGKRGLGSGSSFSAAWDQELTLCISVQQEAKRQPW